MQFSKVLAACRQVNFHNSNVNIGLPVFTIHGNHDDPSGDHNLSAVDVLSSCNLVNYFGRAVRLHDYARKSGSACQAGW